MKEAVSIEIYGWSIGWCFPGTAKYYISFKITYYKQPRKFMINSSRIKTKRLLASIKPSLDSSA